MQACDEPNSPVMSSIHVRFMDETRQLVRADHAGRVCHPRNVPLPLIDESHLTLHRAWLMRGLDWRNRSTPPAASVYAQPGFSSRAMHSVARELADDACEDQKDTPKLRNALSLALVSNLVSDCTDQVFKKRPECIVHLKCSAPPVVPADSLAPPLDHMCALYVVPLPCLLQLFLHNPIVRTGPGPNTTFLQSLHDITFIYEDVYWLCRLASPAPWFADVGHALYAALADLRLGAERAELPQLHYDADWYCRKVTTALRDLHATDTVLEAARSFFMYSMRVLSPSPVSAFTVRTIQSLALANGYINCTFESTAKAVQRVHYLQPDDLEGQTCMVALCIPGIQQGPKTHLWVELDRRMFFYLMWDDARIPGIRGLMEEKDRCFHELVDIFVLEQTHCDRLKSLVLYEPYDEDCTLQRWIRQLIDDSHEDSWEFETVPPPPPAWNSWVAAPVREHHQWSKFFWRCRTQCDTWPEALDLAETKLANLAEATANAITPERHRSIRAFQRTAFEEHKEAHRRRLQQRELGYPVAPAREAEPAREPPVSADDHTRRVADKEPSESAEEHARDWRELEDATREPTKRKAVCETESAEEEELEEPEDYTTRTLLRRTDPKKHRADQSAQQNEL